MLAQFLPQAVLLRPLPDSITPVQRTALDGRSIWATETRQPRRAALNNATGAITHLPGAPTGEAWQPSAAVTLVVRPRCSAPRVRSEAVVWRRADIDGSRPLSPHNRRCRKLAVLDRPIYPELLARTSQDRWPHVSDRPLRCRPVGSRPASSEVVAKNLPTRARPGRWRWCTSGWGWPRVSGCGVLLGRGTRFRRPPNHREGHAARSGSGR
jgi:hypothetical protein